MKSLSLTRQLTILIGVLVLLVAMLVSLIGYTILRYELDQQARSRLVDAERYVITALQLERARVENTVRLASQRPTLIRLMQNGDADALSTYLADFLNSTPLDFLYVSSRDSAFMAGMRQPEDVIAMTSAMSLEDGGQVVGGILLDDHLADSLEQQTGLGYRFTPGIPSESEDIVYEVMAENPYYRINVPLNDVAVDSPASVVLYLPLSGVLAGQQQAALPLVVFSLGIAGITALAGGLFARVRVRPVWQLAAHARRIGQGDLQTPIVVSAKSQEVQSLARSLDGTRIQLQQNIQELTGARKWAESLIQSVVEGIVTCDAGGSILFFSEGAVQITGWSAADAIGQSINQVFRLAEAVGNFMDYIPAEGNRFTLAALRRDGRTVDIGITRAHPVRDQHVTIVIHDVTEEIQRRSVQTYFLATMSHEFKTPLAGMKASLELLLENLRYLSAEEIEELLRSIFLSLTTLQNLIENLLESSKIEANHFVLRREDVQIEDALADAIRLIQPLIDRRQQTINLELPFVVPVLSIDRSRMVQVMVNLLTNASKYSPMESIIDVVIECQGNDLRISVLDHGPGIPDEQRAQVFKQFVRLDRAARSDYGSGLGLAVVKTIVEAHGGQVGVDSGPDQGSNFWFVLPGKNVTDSHRPVLYEG